MRQKFFALCIMLVAAQGCGPAPTSDAPEAKDVTAQWLSRAEQSFKSGDIDDAAVAVEGALKAAPRDAKTRTMGARVALARLDYAEVIRLTEGLVSTEARGLRGRALWYSGDIERAADELEEMLRDPAVKDSWARDVAKLARRGTGRTPFATEGGLVAAVEMPGAGGPAMVVPCELEGERILALVATNFGELMLDSATRSEPAWVNLRFGDRFEVKDVPALTHDLSGISRTLGAPIKALLGVNVLRHLNATVDRRGSQFVVRQSDPPAPPGGSRATAVYARGGALLLRAAVGPKETDRALLFADTSAFYPMALDESVLAKSGADLSTFRGEPGAPSNWKIGALPYFKLSSVDIPGFPAVQGVSVAEHKTNFDIDVTGIAGAGLLSVFRITFGNQGRALWLELDPTMGSLVPATEPSAQRREPTQSSADVPVAAPERASAKSSGVAAPEPAPAKSSGVAAPGKTESKGAAK